LKKVAYLSIIISGAAVTRENILTKSQFIFEIALKAFRFKHKKVLPF
jgi:hypothetical protein